MVAVACAATAEVAGGAVEVATAVAGAGATIAHFVVTAEGAAVAVAAEGAAVAVGALAFCVAGERCPKGLCSMEKAHEVVKLSKYVDHASGRSDFDAHPEDKAFAEETFQQGVYTWDCWRKIHDCLSTPGTVKTVGQVLTSPTVKQFEMHEHCIKVVTHDDKTFELLPVHMKHDMLAFHVVPTSVDGVPTSEYLDHYGNATYAWMFGDAGKINPFRKFARFNPCRWSSKLSAEEAMAEIAGALQTRDRPIRLRESRGGKAILDKEFASAAEFALRFLKTRS